MSPSLDIAQVAVTGRHHTTELLSRKVAGKHAGACVGRLCCEALEVTEVGDPLYVPKTNLSGFAAPPDHNTEPPAGLVTWKQLE